MTILFIDHAYHKTTNSSNFFIELLEEIGAVERQFIDPISECYRAKRWSDLCRDYSFVVLWQIDYLAPYFIRQGKRTIVVPMFDGSAGYKDMHWRAMRGALVVCFSLALYSRARSAGVEAVYVKYCPPSQTAPPLLGHEESGAVTGPRAFFWERIPDKGLNAKHVASRLQHCVSQLHVHQAPDPGQRATELAEIDTVSISCSSWYKNRADYIAKIANCDIYVAPRYAEGIGFGFLEAMNLGLAVIAHNSPVHDEYIKDGVNGLLVDLRETSAINLSRDQVRRMATRAKSDTEKMQERWREYYQPLLISEIQRFVTRTENREQTHPVETTRQPRVHALGMATKNRGKYYAHLEWLLGTIASNAEGQYMPSVRRAIQSQDYEGALSILYHAATKYPDSKIYSRAHRRLTEWRRVRLAHSNDR